VVRRVLQGTSLPIALALLLTGCGADVSTADKASTPHEAGAGRSPDTETFNAWDQRVARYEVGGSAIGIEDSGRPQPNVSAPYLSNLQNCFDGLAYSCDRRLLSDADARRVAVSDYQRNVRNCLDGLTYSCDRRQLSEADANQVAVSDYQRNVRNCLDGLTYSCNRRLLSKSDAQQVASSDYRRNFQSCLDGLTYSCDRRLLSEADAEQVAASDYQRNFSNCLQGLTYTCDQSRLSLEDQKRVDITLLQKQTVTTPLVLPGCAENGSCYGDISELTGRPKTVAVRGYYRSDGTYVRGHYRSAPRR
jgi:hypothetical protein